MTTVILTKRFHFSAAHRLHAEQLSDAENAEIFGKCNGVNGHGHNYMLEVSVAGDVDPVTGMVMNGSALRTMVGENLLIHVDHKNLNLDVERLAGVNPTVENLALHFWQWLRASLPPHMRLIVTLSETDSINATYDGG